MASKKAKPQGSTIDPKALTQKVFEFIQTKKIASTEEIATKFGIRSQQAAARVAILRIKEMVQQVPNPGKKGDSSSCWSVA